MMRGFFGENLFDENWLSTPIEREFFGNHYGEKSLMRTDVKELEDTYEIDIDLPGFKKEDLQLELKNGYLTIRATKDDNNDQKNNEGKYIRRERFVGSCTRSFYIGKNVKQEQVHAKFEDGILKLTVPKENQQKVEENKFISIEG